MAKARLFAGYPKEYSGVAPREVFTVFKEPGTRRTQHVDVNALDSSQLTAPSGQIGYSNIIFDSRFPILGIEGIFIGSLTIPAASNYRAARYTLGSVPSVIGNKAFIVSQDGVQVKATDIVFTVGDGQNNQANAYRQVSFSALNGTIYVDEVSITQGYQIPSQTLNYVVIFLSVTLP